MKGLFFEALEIPAAEKARLKQLTPASYIGLAVELSKEYSK